MLQDALKILEIEAIRIWVCFRRDLSQHLPAQHVCDIINSPMLNAIRSYRQKALLQKVTHCNHSPD